MQKHPINKNKSSKQNLIRILKENKTEEQRKDSVDKNQEIINDLKHKLKECEDKLLRSLAENDNLRKSNLKKKQRIT